VILKRRSLPLTISQETLRRLQARPQMNKVATTQ
jgi:hypothetical protein